MVLPKVLLFTFFHLSRRQIWSVPLLYSKVQSRPSIGTYPSVPMVFLKNVNPVILSDYDVVMLL
jgi:hypothetical protein